MVLLTTGAEGASHLIPLWYISQPPDSFLPELEVGMVLDAVLRPSRPLLDIWLRIWGQPGGKHKLSELMQPMLHESWQNHEPFDDRKRRMASHTSFPSPFNIGCINQFGVRFYRVRYSGGHLGRTKRPTTSFSELVYSVLRSCHLCELPALCLPKRISFLPRLLVRE